jgi:sulfate adenylyltransferase
LVDLLVTPTRAAELKADSKTYPSFDLNPRQLCDLELLTNGTFSPLSGFMGQRDYEGVLSGMRLANGVLWPIPVTLDVAAAVAEKWGVGERIALRDPEGTMIAVLTVGEMWRPDKAAEAAALYGTSKITHPQVRNLLEHVQEVYVAGRLEALQLPTRYDFAALRRTPAAVRARQQRDSIGYLPTHLMHRKHVEFTRAVADAHGATLLINAALGADEMTGSWGFRRVRCYKAAMEQYPAGTATLNLLPLNRRHGGVREGLLDAVISKNFGCAHVVVEHDYDHRAESPTPPPKYGSYRTQALVANHTDELGVKVVGMRDLVLEEDRVEHFLPAVGGVVAAPARRLTQSLTEIEKQAIVDYFAYPAVVEELRRFHPPKEKQGVTIFFTGLSGSGKSTISNILFAKLAERDDRPITLLDGDLVRKHLSSELGFSREHRDLNVRRIGYAASLITRNRGIAICAPIAPYEKTRADVRAMIEADGAFIEVYVATPLDVCESRDRKGLYAKARAGLVKEFTGISDPYEAPQAPEITIKTTDVSAEEAAAIIVQYLEDMGLAVPTVGQDERAHPQDLKRHRLSHNEPKVLVTKQAH